MKFVKKHSSQKYWKFLTTLLLLLPAMLWSQEIFVRNFTPGYNIEQRKITAASENNDGFLLIGTKGALFVFDGLNYHQLAFPDSLSEIEVKTIGHKGATVFAGLSDGTLLSYRQLHLGLQPEKILSCEASITAIEIDDKGQMWVSTYGDGIYLLRNEQETLHINTENGLPDGYVYDLQKDFSGNMWAGTDAGLVKIRLEDNGINIQVFAQKEGLPDLIVTALGIDIENNLWLGMHNGGFCFFDIDNEKIAMPKFSEEWKNGVVQSILMMDGYVWIASQDKGLYAWCTRTKQLFSFHNDVPQRIIQLGKSLLRGFWVVNAEQILWTAGRQIENVPMIGTQSTVDLFALLVDKRGFLWFSNENGLFRTKAINPGEDFQEIKISSKSHSTIVSSIYEDDDGWIWLGTFDEGLKVLNPENLSFKSYNETDGLANNSILSIDGNGNEIWFATLGGASKATKKTDGTIQFQSFSQNEGLGTNYIYHVKTDSQQRIWFATDGRGISYFENGSFHQPKHEILKEKVFYAVAEDAQNAIWLASSDDGLYRIKGDSLKRFGIEEGLSSLTITSLASNLSPHLIVAGNNGIDLINIYSGEVIQAGRHYGLNLKQTALNSIAADSDVAFFISTNKGILRLENIPNLANRMPLIKMKKLLVNLKPFDFERKIKLKHNQSQVSIAFSGIWYPNPEEVRFLVKQNGSESNQFETRDQVLNYGSLSPGKYRFHIAEAGHKKSDFDALTLEIEIKKPIWFEWWFLAGSLVVFSVLLLWWLRDRENKIKMQQHIRQDKLEFEYRNLRNQVNPHFLFNSFSTLIAMIENDGKNAVDYVEKLSDYFRQILQYRDSELIPLKEEMQLLETYIYLQQKRYGSGLMLKTEIPSKFLFAKIPPMTLQMLAENALKHNMASKSKPLYFEIIVNNEFILVQNNLQPKQSKEISMGLGLKNISERFRLFAGKEIKIEKTQEMFLVKLPLIQ
ncbi:MAG: two-component regulator propeller domain-containing protein [Bacteroidales bacterium]|nr:two-component regulator propeller domain-containing protein [Bacteroidales bacterium]